MSMQKGFFIGFMILWLTYLILWKWPFFCEFDEFTTIFQQIDFFQSFYKINFDHVFNPFMLFCTIMYDFRHFAVLLVWCQIEKWSSSYLWCSRYCHHVVPIARTLWRHSHVMSYHLFRHRMPQAIMGQLLISNRYFFTTNFFKTAFFFSVANFYAQKWLKMCKLKIVG